MSVLQKIGAPSRSEENGEFLCDDGIFSTEFPGLWEFLSRVRLAGQDRKPGRLILYCEPEKVCLCLSDKHTDSVAFHVAEGVQEALEGAEKRLQEGRLDWRQDKRKRQW